MKDVDESTDMSSDTDTTKKPSKEEIISTNLEFFLGIASIVPRISSRDSSTYSDGILGTMMVAAWEDTKFLKSLEIYWNWFDPTTTWKNPPKPGEVPTSKPKAVSAILSIEFSFEIHGVSGLKVGDMFQVIDIPSRYKNGVFQIMEQSHSLTGGIWITSVKSQLRNFTV